MTTPRKPKKSESITKFIDTSVRPQDDFYQYVNGLWLKKASIPADKSRWGSFDQLREASRKHVREIIQEVSKKKRVQKGSPEQMLRDLYDVGMDMKRRNSEKYAVVMSLVDKVDALESKQDLARFVGSLHRKGIGAFFDAGVEPDMKNTEIQSFYMAQGGLHLPDRDYYIKNTSDMKKIREAYRHYIVSMLELVGVEQSDAKKRADVIIRFETKLARKMMSQVELRDYEKQYNVYGARKRNQSFKGFDWDTYNESISVPKTERTIIAQPEYFSLLSTVLEKGPSQQVREYLKWCIIQESADFTTNKAGELTYILYGKTLSGMEKRSPLWKRITGVVEASLGEALGQIYVKKHFSEKSKKKIHDMVKQFILVYEKRIHKLDWMSGSTKKKALIKLHAFDALLAYPDKWRNYKGLRIDREKSYLENIYAVSEYEFNRNIKKLGKKVDRKEWHMYPQTVNAYCDFIRNLIAFPAGIMQPPFFDPNQDDAVNYGSIGMVIAHEMTHGFDDQGSRFDEKGNMKNWWTKKDRLAFDERSKVLVKQFNAYKVHGQPVNGELTLGENIADLGGVVIAYEALMETLSDKQKQQTIQGLTPAQRFFIGGARAWREISRKEYALKALILDPHSPEHLRVNGPLSNMEEFYEAFDVKEGDKLWRPEKERAKIW